MKLLTQNSDLRKSGIFGFTLPAHVVTLEDGSRFNVCPNAGVCGAFCYAKRGTYQFSNVKKAHMKKLDLVLNHRSKWISMMIDELSHRRYRRKYIRIHDAGDFFSIDYARDWMKIIREYPDIRFYAYTKEVSMMKSMEKNNEIPDNFRSIYSYGGKEDHLIDPEVDRHSDVFTDYDLMISRGYVDIEEDDSLAATSENHRIGLYRNNIPYLIKKQGDKSFREWQPKSVKV